MTMMLRHRSIRLVGTVTWLHEGGKGLSGQIDFEPTPMAELCLVEFLGQRAAGPAGLPEKRG
jgi:hypothetical protein